jgi:DNA-directed RNA polymerase specialized sigma24 family protein
MVGGRQAGMLQDQCRLDFRAWLFTAARHRAVDWHRRAARQPTQPLPVELLAEQTAPDDPPAAVLGPSPPGRPRS